MQTTRPKAMTLEAFARLFTPEASEATAGREPMTKPSGTRVTFGTTYNASRYGLSDLELWPLVPDGFEVAWGWCAEPYRIVWVNLEARAIITYCEGDVSIAISPTPEAFRDERLDARNFYGKPRHLDRDYLGLSSETDDPEGRGE